MKILLFWFVYVLLISKAWRNWIDVVNNRTVYPVINFSDAHSFVFGFSPSHFRFISSFFPANDSMHYSQFELMAFILPDPFLSTKWHLNIDHVRFLHLNFKWNNENNANTPHKRINVAEKLNCLLIEKQQKNNNNRHSLTCWNIYRDPGNAWKNGNDPIFKALCTFESELITNDRTSSGGRGERERERKRRDTSEWNICWQ